MHGLYDGGHGRRRVTTGRRSRRPRSAPAAPCGCSPNEGLVRTKDRHGVIDTFGNHGADGIAELRRERDGAGRVGRQANDDEPDRPA